MKVGDLVELSSAGKKIQQNSCVYGRFGMIIGINTTSHDDYPYEIEWYGRGRSKLIMARREIKHYKVKV